MTFYEFEGKRPRVDDKAFIHPEAVLIGDVTVEKGCYIGAGAVLRGDIGSIKIGQGSNVQENCVLHAFPDKLTLLHRNTHVGHGCILHGCEICSNVLVGMGSIIADGVKINRNCLIGAGSFILFRTEIPPNSVVVGSPAKVVKKISQDQLQQLESSRAVYQDLARRHLRAFKEIDIQEALKEPD